jgi:hypothetical protein
MRIVLTLLVFIPLLSVGQVFNRFWPNPMIESINRNPQQVTGTINSDTLFYYQQTTSGAYFYNLRAQFELTRNADQSFQLGVFSRDSAISNTTPYYTNYYNQDSVKHLMLVKRADYRDSTVYFSNGVIAHRETVTDTSYAIHKGDSTERNTVYEYVEHGKQKVYTVTKDTTIYGIPGSLSFEIRNETDTIRYSLKDRNQRIYTQIGEWKTIRHQVKGQDTLILETYQRDTNILTIYKPDSIYTYGNWKSASPYIYAGDRITGNSVLEYFYQGKVRSRLVTTQTKDGYIKKEFDFKDGKEELVRKEVKTPTRHTVLSFNNGKQITKSVSEWDGSTLLKTTVWHKGEKQVYYPQDLVTENPQCGFRVQPRPDQLIPLVDSVHVRLNGELLEHAYYNQLFFKVDDRWMDLELFEDYLVRNYVRSIETPEQGIKLVFKSIEGQSKFRTNGPYRWKELFGSNAKPSEFTYSLSIDGKERRVKSLDVTLCIGLTATYRSSDKYIDNAARNSTY